MKPVCFILMLILPLILAVPGFSFDFGGMQPNRWYEVQTRWDYSKAGLPGQFDRRNWCTLRYNSVNRSIIFYEGFATPSHGGYCIYANALYEYNPGTDTIKLVKLSNWYCNYSPPTELPANAGDPTPADRHTYSQFTYVPVTNSLYLAHGASGSDLHRHDFWRYSFDSGAWTNLGNAPGGSEGWECTCEGNLLYRPSVHSVFLIGGFINEKVYACSLQTGQWRQISVSGAPGITLGGHGCYDSLRDRFVFYGNGWTSDNHGTHDFVFFDLATGAWQHQTPTGVWPPEKYYAQIEYNSKWDVYMLFGGAGQHDTWIYDPQASKWSRLVSTVNPPDAGTEHELAYDPFHDVLVRLDLGSRNMWLLRYTPTGVQAIRKTGNRSPLQAIVQYLRSGAVIRMDVSNYAAVYSCRNPLRIALYDATGRVVKEAMSSTPSFEWDARAMNPGIYLLRIQTKDGQFQKPVILYN